MQSHFHMKMVFEFDMKLHIHDIFSNVPVFRELEIRAAEQKRLEGGQAPDSVDEFEQLVRASPNSSFVWIKYMAFLLSIADVEKARAIAER